MTGFRFGKFIEAIGASVTLLRRSIENGCFIECVCLLASQIDAMLRTAIILNDQIINRSKDIEESLIYQAPDDKPIYEREVYRRANEVGIIDDEVHDKLSEAYNERNKVVHRYIISEIRTVDILDLAQEYFEIKDVVYDILYRLEKKQVEMGVGITIKGDITGNRAEQEEMEKRIKDAIREKHGDPVLSARLAHSHIEKNDEETIP